MAGFAFPTPIGREIGHRVLAIARGRHVGEVTLGLLDGEGSKHLVLLDRNRVAQLGLTEHRQ